VDILARRPHIPVEYPPADPVPNIKIVELDIFKHSAWIQATASACHVPSSLKLLIEMVKYMWSLIHAASQVVMTVGNSSMAIKATLFNKKNVNLVLLDPTASKVFHIHVAQIALLNLSHPFRHCNASKLPAQKWHST
jgi:hypothetical protein